MRELVRDCQPFVWHSARHLRRHVSLAKGTVGIDGVGDALHVLANTSELALRPQLRKLPLDLVDQFEDGRQHSTSTWREADDGHSRVGGR